MKILIADDDITSRTLLSAVTRKWGFQPIEVEDGQAAWEVLQAYDAPQLLLIDWEMPRLDGIALSHRIRQKNSQIEAYIILLTARSGTEDTVIGLEAGANDYISKPFANEELQARLQVGKRMMTMQHELKRTRDVLRNEREVIENIILKMRHSKPLDLSYLRTLDRPVENTSGDIFVSAHRPDCTKHIILGDFTGHGLTAAIGGPIVYDIFYAMTAKNLKLQDIAIEINRHLLQKLPTGLFLGAIFIELNPEHDQLAIWNCGMSEVLLYRDSKLKQKVHSSLLALGIVEQDFEMTAKIPVIPGDKIYAYSDGITEATNDQNEEFGQQQLEKNITDMLINNHSLDFLFNQVIDFQGDSKQADDITLIELTCQQILEHDMFDQFDDEMIESKDYEVPID